MTLESLIVEATPSSSFDRLRTASAGVSDDNGSMKDAGCLENLHEGFLRPEVAPPAKELVNEKLAV